MKLVDLAENVIYIIEEAEKHGLTQEQIENLDIIEHFKLNNQISLAVPMVLSLVRLTNGQFAILRKSDILALE